MRHKAYTLHIQFNNAIEIYPLFTFSVHKSSKRYMPSLINPLLLMYIFTPEDEYFQILLLQATSQETLLLVHVQYFLQSLHLSGKYVPLLERHKISVNQNSSAKRCSYHHCFYCFLILTFISIKKWSVIGILLHFVVHVININKLINFVYNNLFFFLFKDVYSY